VDNCLLQQTVTLWETVTSDLHELCWYCYDF
jgi:hypothetical protein